MHLLAQNMSPANVTGRNLSQPHVLLKHGFVRFVDFLDPKARLGSWTSKTGKGALMFVDQPLVKHHEQGGPVLPLLPALGIHGFVIDRLGRGNYCSSDIIQDEKSDEDQALVLHADALVLPEASREHIALMGGDAGHSSVALDKLNGTEAIPNVQHVSASIKEIYIGKLDSQTNEIRAEPTIVLYDGSHIAGLDEQITPPEFGIDNVIVIRTLEHSNLVISLNHFCSEDDCIKEFVRFISSNPLSNTPPSAPNMGMPSVYISKLWMQPSIDQPQMSYKRDFDFLQLAAKATVLTATGDKFPYSSLEFHRTVSPVVGDDGFIKLDRVEHNSLSITMKNFYKGAKERLFGIPYRLKN